MTRKEQIIILKELLINHKAGLAILDEYTIVRYEFLKSEGLINFTQDEMKEIFNVAKGEYAYELNNLVNTGGIVDSHTAQELLKKLEENLFTPDTLEYLYKKCKIISLKRFLDNANEIEL